jgi:hypothetical protein
VGRGKPLFAAEWTDFWHVAEEIGIPIHVHLSPDGLHSLTPKLGSWEMPLALHGPGVLRKVTCENAARVYGFKV